MHAEPVNNEPRVRVLPKSGLRLNAKLVGMHALDMTCAGLMILFQPTLVMADHCTNECSYAFDGSCDDGGDAARYSLCVFNSDCKDCGVRIHSDKDVCHEGCLHASDGACDDGDPPPHKLLW